MSGKESTLLINVFFHKENVKDISDCIREDVSDNLKSDHQVKNSIGLPGKIFIHKPTSNPPDWEVKLNKLTDSNIQVEKNTSNRALVILKYKKRFFSITFGYGRYMLDFDTIVNNFGLKVAANIIDSNKLKSMSSTSFETAVLHSQKQVTKLLNQDQFRINKDLELLKEVSGSPSSESTTKFVAGSDSLKVSRQMDITNIKEAIQYFYEKYTSNDYISKGFEWIDNIQEVKDKATQESLNNKLCENIVLVNTDVSISANRITDWDSIQGFRFKGIGKTNTTMLELDDENYLQYLRDKINKRPEIDILGKLKRDHILQINNNGQSDIISTVYKGIDFETSHNDKQYLLEEGNWYEISEDFYARTVDRLQNVLSNNIELPNSLIDESEEQYNSRVGKKNNIFCLDQNNFMFSDFGRSKMEPCDLITRDMKFIHVKNRKGNGSSVLSHWFAQGKTSAEILSQDIDFREFVNEQVSNKFGKNFITENARNNNFEIIFALIMENDGEVVDNLPFFSMVNLVKTLDELATSDFRYSLCAIRKGTLENETIEQLELISN